MKYTIEGMIITFKPTKFTDHFKLDKKAFDEAPYAEQVVIEDKKGNVLMADANAVLAFAVPSKTGKRDTYTVPISVFRGVPTIKV